jgi:hypothetical protein
MNEIDQSHKIEKLKSLVEINSELLNSIQNQFNEIAQEIFKDSCLKDYLKQCEPEFCSFRLTNTCKYFDKLEPLHDLKKKFELKL